MGKYEELQHAHLGLTEVLAYRCWRCWYVWLPKDVEILTKDTLVDHKPPRVCARCKSRLWNSPIPERKSKIEPLAASIARVRSLLRAGKLYLAVNLLSQTSPKKTELILKKLEKEYGFDIISPLREAVLLTPYSQEQALETFKPPSNFSS